MGRQIIKQPNGLYCIWSTIVDDIIACDMTREDYINMRVEEEKEKITKDINEICDYLDRGEKPFYYTTNRDYKDVADRVQKLREE
jgi:GH25 family lysozyme M1 (1,4-beta-N-acetylmuramidase)